MVAPLAVKVGVVPAQILAPEEEDTDMVGVVNTVFTIPLETAVSPQASIETVIVLEDNEDEL